MKKNDKEVSIKTNLRINESNVGEAIAALRKCANENRGRETSTGNVTVSNLCNDVADYLESKYPQKDEKAIKEWKAIFVNSLSLTENMRAKENKVKGVDNITRKDVEEITALIARLYGETITDKKTSINSLIARKRLTITRRDNNAVTTTVAPTGRKRKSREMMEKEYAKVIQHIRSGKHSVRDVEKWCKENKVKCSFGTIRKLKKEFAS